jgi:hypothetical protein
MTLNQNWTNFRVFKQWQADMAEWVCCLARTTEVVCSGSSSDWTEKLGIRPTICPKLQLVIVVGKISGFRNSLRTAPYTERLNILSFFQTSDSIVLSVRSLISDYDWLSVFDGTRSSNKFQTHRKTRLIADLCMFNFYPRWCGVKYRALHDCDWKESFSITISQHYTLSNQQKSKFLASLTHFRKYSK